MEFNFILSVCKRFITLLLRKRKDIQSVHLSCTRKDLFKNSYVILSYDFKNVLWYNFKKIKKTTEKGVLVLDIEKLPTNPIQLMVIGFFRRKTFEFQINPNRKLESSSFKVETKNICEQKPVMIDFVLKDLNPYPMFLPPNLNLKEVYFKPNLYHHKQLIWKKEITISFPNPPH